MTNRKVKDSLPADPTWVGESAANAPSVALGRALVGGVSRACQRAVRAPLKSYPGGWLHIHMLRSFLNGNTPHMGITACV